MTRKTIHPPFFPSRCDCPLIPGLVLALVWGLVLLGGCAGSGIYEDQKQGASPLPPPAPWPDITMAIVSDIHVMVPELGITGRAFQDYLDQDSKLLHYSTGLVAELGRKIRAAEPELLLISGDLTKDGEIANHQWVADWCRNLADQGIMVRVIPGNHDLDNPHATRFVDDRTEVVDHASPAEFAQIYGEFGFGDALDRDSASLSYVSQIKPGLRLIALDSTRSQNNLELGYPEVSGELGAATMAWLEQALIRCRQDRQAMVVMMHHGLAEHWKGNKKFAPDYIVEKHRQVQALLAHYGARICFTGHAHAQDVARVEVAGQGWIYDIETGSPMTWPLPWRQLQVRSQIMEIRSHRIESIAAKPQELGEYAQEFAYNGIIKITTAALASYGVRGDEARYIAAQGAQAYLAHYQGDEKLPDGVKVPDTDGLGFMGRMVVENLAYVLLGLWEDSQGCDNNLDINLVDGTWTDRR